MEAAEEEVGLVAEETLVLHKVAALAAAAAVLPVWVEAVALVAHRHLLDMAPRVSTVLPDERQR